MPRRRGLGKTEIQAFQHDVSFTWSLHCKSQSPASKIVASLSKLALLPTFVRREGPSSGFSGQGFKVGHKGWVAEFMPCGR